jgi:hypothetical protein
VSQPRRQRVVVANPKPGIPARPTVRDEFGEQTRLGDILIRSLIRTQLHLALRLGAVLGVLLGALPLLFAYAPGIRHIHLLGLPLPWLLLGVLVYPVLLGGAAIYVRQAERNERDFEDFVDRS